MKRLLPFLILLLSRACSQAQITTPIIKSGFGVDGDLRANFFNNFVTSGNDDWFITGGIGGTYVIDTTGASSVLAGYTADVSPFPNRMAAVYRSMRVAPYTVVNNRLWLDALWVRDYHGTDTTVFVQGSSKNGMSPAEWGGTIQSVPDKNEILDMMMHLRRAGDGQDPTRVDSLWFFGGLSIENTSGNRYFDFELYQTDIYYDRTSQKFYGYGPDAGHTSWQFDASGNIVKPGDIIFSASYQSSMLTGIEARIWIDKASLNITPAGFSWSGQFDGASNGAQYGYASITPKTSGNFYTGLENSRAAWAGPFKLIRADNSIADDFSIGQFMEFSVNLTKLGIDPATMLGGDVCGSPFNRMVVKTRASDAFTSSLKDFVAPIDLFLAPRADASTDVPYYCGASGISELRVLNPTTSSVYTWSTLDGNIVGSTTGTTVVANAPGTYVVMQQLSAGCNAYAYDTLTIIMDPTCTTLANEDITLQASLKAERPQLSWTSTVNDKAMYYELESSYDGKSFTVVRRFENRDKTASLQTYTFEDIGLESPVKYYRVKAVTTAGRVYSRISFVQAKSKVSISVTPNPASSIINCSFTGVQDQRVRLAVYSIDGKLVYEKNFQAVKGNNAISIYEVQGWPDGIYMVLLQAGTETQRQRIVVHRAR